MAHSGLLEVLLHGVGSKRLSVRCEAVFAGRYNPSRHPEASEARE